MARFLPAYNARTGRKLPNFVPEHWFDHPVLGKNLRRTPRSAGKKAEATAAADTKAPASGDDEKE